MNLKTFASIYLDGLFEPRLPEESQCSGWFHLKYLVESKVKVEELTDDMLIPFHPNLRTYLRKNWYRIYGLEIG